MVGHPELLGETLATTKLESTGWKITIELIFIHLSYVYVTHLFHIY